MIDDKELDKLLSAYNPHIQGGEDFMQILSQKMAAVDMVMQYKEREEKAYRRRSIMCFAGTAIFPSSDVASTSIFVLRVSSESDAVIVRTLP